MRVICLFTLISVLPCFHIAFFAQQPMAESVVTPCIPQNGTQHCSEIGLHAAVTTATSVAVESGARDRIGGGQLRSFVASLGKSVALDQESAGVSLKLVQIDQAGVNYGAADRELAKLEVYAPVGPAKRQQLIWIETLTGPADLPWPTAVARLLQQFRDRVKPS